MALWIMKSLSKLLIHIWPIEGTTKNCRKYNKNRKITKKFDKIINWISNFFNLTIY